MKIEEYIKIRKKHDGFDETRWKHKEENIHKLIDYIFISKNSDLKVKKYAVLSDAVDLKYPSDHLPIFVELKYK